MHPGQCPIQRAKFVSQIGFISSPIISCSLVCSTFIFPLCLRNLWISRPDAILPDEAGIFIKNHSHDKAWAIQGRHLPPLIANCISLLPAVSLDELLMAFMAQEGTFFLASILSIFWMKAIMLSYLGAWSHSPANHVGLFCASAA